MKYILSLCLLTAGYLPVLAQAGSSLDVAEPGAVNGYGTVRFSNPSGNSDKVDNIDLSDISGSPYYSEKWTAATVVLTDDKLVKLNKARLNLYNNELHYIYEGGIEMVVDDRNVKRVYLVDARDTAKVITFNVVQNYNGKPGGTYMQALNQGGIQLLKINAIQLNKKDYDPIRGKNLYSFQQAVSYVFLKNGVFIPCKTLNKADIFTVLTPEARANTWLTNSKNKLKNEKEVIAFLDWYNVNGAQ